MDPNLEHPSLWPDVHNSLIAAIGPPLEDQVAVWAASLVSGKNGT
jgi:hypothetical protein